MNTSEAVAIVTGAAQGIGLAIARALARAGACVAMVDILEDRLQAAAGQAGASAGAVLAISADITDADAVQDMVAQVRAELGPPGVLVNNAGSLTALGPVWEVDPARWVRDATVNLCGTFLCTRFVVPHMIKAGGGYVVNLVGAGVGPVHLYTTGYDASKAGVVRLTEGLARECAEHGVRAFALFPGLVRSAMTEFIASSPEGRRWRPTFAEHLEHAIEPERAAEVVLDLISGRADALSGCHLDVGSYFDVALPRADQVRDGELLVLRLRPLPAE